jgi:lysozyme
MRIASVDDLIKFHEGFTPVAKPDAKGKLEYGYGFDIDPPAPGEPALSIARDEADARFPGYLAIATSWAMQAVGPGVWSSIDAVRQAVVVDMAYEIGGAGLLKFHQFLGAVRARDWPAAKADLVASLLYRQVPTREAMNCQMLIDGQWPEV